jgi:hypothetical protein
VVHDFDRANRSGTLTRTFLRTPVGKFVVLLLLIALGVFVASFVIALSNPGASGAKTGFSLAALFTAVGTAGATLHVSRQRISTIVERVWFTVEPMLARVEMEEAIAQSTRRLPGDTVGGSSAPATRRTRPAGTERARRI